MKKEERKLDLFLISKYRSLLMGLAIIMVVFHHLTIKGDSNIFEKAYMFLRVTGAMGVDIFLFVSGIGLYKSFSKKENIKEFYKKRLKRIIPTYLLICIPYLVLKYLIFIPTPNLKEFLSSVFLISYFTRGEGDWYIAAIIILYFLFPIFYKIIKKYKFGLILLLLIWLVVTVTVRFIFPQMFHNTETFWPRIPIFIFGIWIAKYVFEHKMVSFKWIIYSIIINLIALIIEGYFCLKGAEVAYLFLPRLFYFPLSLTFVIIILYLISKIRNFENSKICQSLISLGG